MPALILGRGELGADLAGFGCAESGIEGQGLLPVIVSPAGLAQGVMRPGETVVRAGLLVLVTDLAGQRERGGILGAGLAGLAGG
jgi:hypothetical protein